MKPLIHITFSFVFFFCTLNACAHALFINTNTQGQLGNVHDITVYYAEPEDQNRELIKDWWSDTSDFTLWLTLPNGAQEQLTVNKYKDHFKAVFTPMLEGMYYVSIHHTVSTLAGKTQYQFNASSAVNVGTINDSLNAVTKMGDELLMYQGKATHENELSVVLFKNGAPLDDFAVTVFLPKGGKKEIKTNALGEVHLDAEWAGDYVFEAADTEDVDNQDFKKRVRIITTIINFNPND